MYANYRANRRRYRRDQTVTPIVMMIVIGFMSKVWIDAILTVIAVGVVFILLCFLISCIRTKDPNNKATEAVVHHSNEEKQIERRVNTMKLKTTEAGYVNKNNQKNLGKTDKPGTDFCQWFYKMECLDCGHKYYANGSDIWLRKCPGCQGGRP